MTRAWECCGREMIQSDRRKIVTFIDVHVADTVVHDMHTSSPLCSCYGDVTSSDPGDEHINIAWKGMTPQGVNGITDGDFFYLRKFLSKQGKKNVLLILYKHGGNVQTV